MINRHTRGHIHWVDLESPTREELKDVMQEFGSMRVSRKRSLQRPPTLSSFRQKNTFTLVLHFPASDPNGGAKNQEIDFIIGKHFLITARYEIIESIHNLHKVFEAEELLGLPVNTDHADALLRARLASLVWSASRGCGTHWEKA